MSISSETVPSALDTVCDEARGEVWVVVHVRPRCEKKLSRVCDQQQITTYLPVLRAAHSYGGRKRFFDKPLFPGYLFAIVGSATRPFLRQNDYVANVLTVDCQAELIQQLRHIQQALTAGAIVDVQPHLEKGKRVRVKSGPFKGIEGFVRHIKGGTRVVVNVDMIQQAVAIEVDAVMLEAN